EFFIKAGTRSGRSAKCRVAVLDIMPCGAISQGLFEPSTWNSCGATCPFPDDVNLSAGERDDSITRHWGWRCAGEIDPQHRAVGGYGVRYACACASACRRTGPI